MVFSPNPTEADVENLSVALRKLLYDSTAERASRRGSLLKRSTNHLMLPKINGIEGDFSQLPESFQAKIIPKSIFSIPFGNGPVVANPRYFLSIENWINQNAMIIGGKKYSIKDVFTLFANIDGAHTDTTQSINQTKGNDLALVLNDQIGYRLIYNTAEFLFLWLAQFDELREKFPILEVAKEQLIFSKPHQGFISKKRNI